MVSRRRVTNNLLETIRESAAELALRDAAANGTVIAAPARPLRVSARTHRHAAARTARPRLAAHTVIDTAPIRSTTSRCGV
jgi:hypothetical protein